MQEAVPRAAFVVVALISSANVLLSTLLFYKVTTTGGKQLGWLDTLLVILSTIAVCTAYLGQQSSGRTEPLVTLWFLAGTLLAFSNASIYPWLPFGIFLGLLGATHPVGAVTSATLVGLYYAALYPVVRALVHLARVYLLSLLVFLCILAISPNNALDNLYGIFSIGPQAVNSATTSRTFLSEWIFVSIHPFYGLVLIPSLIYSTYLIVVRRQQIESRVLFLFFLLTLILVLYYFTFRVIATSYNILWLSASFFAINIWAILHLPEKLLARNLIKLALVIIIALSTLGFARSIILFPVFLEHGMSLDEARRFFATLTPTDNSVTTVTGSLWTLSEEYDKIRITVSGSIIENAQRNQSELVIVQQNFSGLLYPPEIEGYTLEHDFFVHRSYELFGIKLANTTPGYQYAVYRRLP